MSTRTNIIITVGDTRVFLYRHCDGYPAETGADLYEKVSAAYGTAEKHYADAALADRLVRALLSEYYDPPTYAPEQHKPVYEITNGLHGDIEHVYTVSMAAAYDGGRLAEGPSIRHATRPDDWYENGLNVDGWAFGGRRYSLDAFRELVNIDRRECNVRLAKLKADQPGAPWGDPYEELTA